MKFEISDRRSRDGLGDHLDGAGVFGAGFDDERGGADEALKVGALFEGDGAGAGDLAADVAVDEGAGGGDGGGGIAILGRGFAAIESPTLGTCGIGSGGIGFARVFCHAEGRMEAAEAELHALQRGAALAHSLGLEVHAGHGLTYDNVGPIAAIPEVMELNIGHFLIGEAIFLGLEDALAEMRHRMDLARSQP